MLRSDHAIIADWVETNSRVLDLGCGDGMLMEHLRKTRNTTGYGVEIDEGMISECIDRGINVIQSDLDEGLADFQDNSFDYVILSMTLQAVTYPDKLLLEMLRVGKEGIVTFPNFAHWSPRLQLMFQGRMPVSSSIPFQWYDTPNIHLCTIHDFENLCDENGVDVLERRTSVSTRKAGLMSNVLPNLFGEIALYRFSKR